MSLNHGWAQLSPWVTGINPMTDLAVYFNLLIIILLKLTPHQNFSCGLKIYKLSQYNIKFQLVYEKKFEKVSF